MTSPDGTKNTTGQQYNLQQASDYKVFEERTVSTGIAHIYQLDLLFSNRLEELKGRI